MAAGLTLSELVDLGDLDELLRRVDQLCDRRDWASLLDLRDRCRAAFERGRQLWPAASHAEYRLALQAPGRWAGAVVTPGAGRFAVAPLSEVVAFGHRWDDLADHLPPTPEAVLVAQERVIRGEDLRRDTRVDRVLSELSLVLQPWEPAYPLPAYKPYSAEFADVPRPPMEAAHVAAAAPVIEDTEAVHALVELVTPWTTQSNGRAAAVAVRGDVRGAIGALGVEGQIRLTAVEPGEALAVMAWAGASGGAHGRRRGMAQGRFGAWWAAAALAGTLDRWPDLGADDLAVVRWYRWDQPQPSTGWAVRLAAERPSDGCAWALEATDQT